MVGRTLRIRLLGGFAVELDGRSMPDHAWRRRRAAALVKLLALAPGHRAPRDAVIDALWPDLDAASGGSNLRKAAHHARRALGIDDSVVLDGRTVHLLPEADVHTDVEAFDAAARDAIESGDAARSRRAAALYTGPLLPDDRYEEWCDRPRQQLEALYRETLLSGQLWGRLLAVDPTREVAHRGVIRERLDAGDRAGAIRQFAEMRALLRDQLGVGPDPASVALYEEVLASEGQDVPTPAERARALLAWATIHWERADLAEAERAATEVRALAIDAGLGRELADASELLGLVAYARGRWQEVFAREFLEAVRRTPELASFIYDANMCMSEFALHQADGLDRLGDFAADLLAVADEHGSDHARGLGLLLQGEVGLLAGDEPGSVARSLSEAARRHQEIGSSTGVALATERLAQLEGRRDTESAMLLHRRARDLAAASTVPQHLLPLVYGGMIDGVDAHMGVAILDEAEEALADGRGCDPCSMSLHVRATTVCARDGQHERAHTHLNEARRIAGMWSDGPWHAGVMEAQALLRHVEGASTDEVRDLLARAAEGYRAAGRHAAAERCQTLI